jgi:predicted AlkP superfamily phosphohydrolase/phosphomutase
VTARVLFVGWDGADWDVLDRLQAEGVMPSLAGLREGGAEGTLLSTFPPHSVAAWTSFLCGRPVSEHRVIDFMACRPGSYFPDIPHTARSVPSPDLLRLLNQQGRRVLCANLPMTFPPGPGRGTLISGVFLPPDAKYTFPPQLQERLAAFGGFPTSAMRWVHAASLPRLLEEAAAVTRQHTTVFREMIQSQDWDVALVAYMAPDRIQHASMHLLDPRHPDHGSAGDEARELMLGVFRELDRSLGALVDAAGAEHVLLASDHGFRAVWEDVVPNRVLEELGHLRFRPMASAARVALRPMRKLIRGRRVVARAGRALGLEARIDWSRTTAYAPSAACMGIRLNVEGREARGVIPPPRFDATLERLLSDLRSFEAEGRRSFQRVFAAEDIAPGVADGPGAPDLFYVPSAGLGVGMDGPSAIKPAGRKSGEHREEGIVARTGGGPVPDSIWQLPHLIAELAGAEAGDWSPSGRPAEPSSLSGREEASIVEHLRGLGYVE